MRFAGQVYRAHDPRWSFAPASGEGAARNGGRFNPLGMAALYTSMTTQTAWREAQQAFAFKMQPMTICAYEVDCDNVADLTDPDTCSGLEVDPSDLACAWRDYTSRGMTPPSWTLTRRLLAGGVAAIIVPSFAADAPASDRNVVFWRWVDITPHQVRVIDDDHRLPRDASSWSP